MDDAFFETCIKSLFAVEASEENSRSIYGSHDQNQSQSAQKDVKVCGLPLFENQTHVLKMQGVLNEYDTHEKAKAFVLLFRECSL